MFISRASQTGTSDEQALEVKKERREGDIREILRDGGQGLERADARPDTGINIQAQASSRQKR